MPLNKRMMFVLFSMLTSSFSAAAENLASSAANERQRNAIIFGSPQSGRIIVDDLKRTCPHLAATLKSAAFDRRTLVFTNLEATAFHSYVCKGPCDRVQQNNSVVECRKSIGISGCRIYGAVFRGEVFQFSFDPAGTDLKTACDLKR
jgi:hypothetical protein